MKTLTILISAFFLSFAAIPDDHSKTASDNGAFAFDIYSSLEKKENNLFLSPYSISSALAMTYAGARTSTADEMARTMHFRGKPAEFDQSFSSLMAELNGRNGENMKIYIANRLFADLQLQLQDSFRKICNDLYKAPVEQVDFRKNYEGARVRINTWVEDNTNKKIVELLKPGVLSNLTRLVLVNAIYFYSDWKYQFDSSMTIEGDFFQTDTSHKAMFMNQRQYFEYMETKEFKAIRMPYKGDAMVMEIYLPNEKNGLEKLERSLNWKNYSSWQKDFRMQEVAVRMPKFKMTTDFLLSKTLKQMGMTDAFSEDADFRGIDGQKDLYIYEVVHKAFVDVSEKGTEAAAATAVIIDETDSVREQYETFNADHPFFFVIKDLKTGSVLFMGRLKKP